jgi:hypothetical protein
MRQSRRNGLCFIKGVMSRRVAVATFSVVVLGRFAGLFFLFYLTNFSRFLYGDIPSSWGGGKPRTVRVIPTSKEKDDVRAAGIQFSQGALVSDRVNLLLVTDKGICFRNGNLID